MVTTITNKVIPHSLNHLFNRLGLISVFLIFSQSKPVDVSKIGTCKIKLGLKLCSLKMRALLFNASITDDTSTYAVKGEAMVKAKIK